MTASVARPLAMSISTTCFFILLPIRRWNVCRRPLRRLRSHVKNQLSAVLYLAKVQECPIQRFPVESCSLDVYILIGPIERSYHEPLACDLKSYRLKCRASYQDDVLTRDRVEPHRAPDVP